MKISKKKVIAGVLAISVACAGVIAGTKHLQKEKEVAAVQVAALDELTRAKGEYAEDSIVLTNTTEEKATMLAEKLGASLRITSNGEFATLTLPEGMTLEEVYEDEAYKYYLSEFSLDYYASTKEVQELFPPVEEDISEEEPFWLASNMDEVDSLDLDEETDLISNRPAHIASRPNYAVADSEYVRQTHLDYLNMRNTWEKTKGEHVLVAVIDTGIDVDNPEFSGRISEYSYNATEDKVVKDWLLEDGSCDWSLIDDEVGHGTAVAGALSAAMDDFGVVGVAPEADLLVIKATADKQGQFYRGSDLVFGLYYAIERNAKVVNMSFGTGEQNLYGEAVKLAVDSDIICIASAGNDGTSVPQYPAADPNVIGVGALAADSWELADYSNYGENVDVVAPGTTLTTTIGNVEVENGTSLAAPLVAAGAALYVSGNPYVSVDSFREVLFASTYDLGPLGKDYTFGYGALDISALVLETKGTVTFDYMTDELSNTKQVFVHNHPLQNLPEPERNYAVFDGWYYDMECTEEVNWYVDAWNADLTLYAKWENEDDSVPYTYVELDDGTIEIRSYTGHRRYITMPDEIDGKTVSSIGADAFADMSRLRSVILPAHLTNIGDRAFARCSNLLNISIPESVKNIGDSAFAETVRMNQVTFEGDSKLQTIGEEAFASSRLTSFTVGKYVSVMNGSCFAGTPIQNYAVEKGNMTFQSVDGIILNTSGSTLVAYPAARSGEYTLPSSVTTIGKYAFAMAKISTIDLSKVVVIEKGAFLSSRLITLDLPDTLTTLGEKAFSYNIYLSDVHIGRGIRTIEKDTFSYDSSITSLYISNGLRSIGDRAFADCSINELTFEENSNLQTIGQGAFSSAGISKLKLPKSVISIGSGAFALTCNLSEVIFEKNSVLYRIGQDAFSGTGSLRTIEFPESLTILEGGAFDRSGLSETVYIPERLTSIGENAFGHCYSLTGYEVAEANPVYRSVEGVLYSKEGASYTIHGTNVAPKGSAVISYPLGKEGSSYTVAEGTTIIEESAFNGAVGLTGILLNEGVEEIHSNAFEGSGITSMVLPASVYQISRYAFAGTAKLQRIAFANDTRIPRLGINAFSGSGITSFDVPASVSTMGQYVFSDCPNLKGITFLENSQLTSLAAYTFTGCEKLESIQFQSSSKLTSIGAHAFEGIANLNRVDFGDAEITSIGNYAFRLCGKLSNLLIPESVVSIGRYAFYGDDALTELYISGSAEHIGRYAFFTSEKRMNIYFSADELPLYLEENWDKGIKGYYLSTNAKQTTGDWTYIVLNSGNISIVKYNGSDEIVDLTNLDLGGDIVSIGGQAFMRSGVKKVILPETLTSIQRNAFAYSNLEEIRIPDKVRFIGQSAFYKTPLGMLTFGEESQLNNLEAYAFAECQNLETVSLPAGITAMGIAVFEGSGLTSVSFTDDIQLQQIPEKTFRGTHLTEVTIPESVTLIGSSAFRDCLELQTVHWGRTNEFRLNSNVFYHSGLTSLTIPANLTYIGEYSFVGLTQLDSIEVSQENTNYASVDGVLMSKSQNRLIACPAGKTGSYTLPKSVEVIGFGAFENTMLSEISFEKDCNILTLGYRAFYNADHLTTVHIPASVISIDYYAFAECDNLQTVEFAENNKLSGVYEGAFYRCGNLEEITLPETIMEISDFTFYGCASLDHLPLKNSDQLKGIYAHAFEYSGIAGEFSVPDSVIDIGQGAFAHTRLTEVTISDVNLEQLTMDYGVFEGCNELEKLSVPFLGSYYGDSGYEWVGFYFGAATKEGNAAYVPKSLTDIQVLYIEQSMADIFEGVADQFEYVSVKHGNTYLGWTAFKNAEHLIGIELPDTLQEIGWQAFSDCPNLEWVKLPESVIKIGELAFSEDSSLSSIELPTKLQSLGSRAFFECSKLTEVHIPEGLTVLEDYTFHGCSSLTSVELPVTLTRIEFDAFSDTGLEEIEIPEGVTYIGDQAFSSSKLRSVHIPDGVQTLGTGAFLYCADLSYCDLPASVTSIGDSCFEGDGILKNIEVPASIEKIGAGAFRFCNSLQTVVNHSNLSLEFGSEENGYVAYYATKIVDADGSVRYRDEMDSDSSLILDNGLCFEVYDNGEAELVSYRGGLEPVTLPLDVNGKPYTIRKNVNIVNLVFPEGMTEIPEDMFFHNSYLESVTLSSTIERIGNHAFTGCENLKNVKLNENLKVIGDWAFAGTGLPAIELPDGLLEIGSGAFEGVSIKSIELPVGLQKLGSRAFQDTKLEEIRFPEGMTEIPENCLFACGNLKNVWLPSTMESISNNALSARLENLYVDEKNPYFVSEDGILYKADKSQIIFANHILPEEITIAGTVQDIPVLAFWGRTGVKKVILQEGITSLADGMFSECPDLETVIIPDSLQVIGNDAFRDCTGISEVRFPERLKRLGDGAFWGTGLKNVEISSDLEYLGSAFGGCSSLKRAEVRGTIDKCRSVFAGCENLEEVILPEGLKEIPWCMFQNCYSLKNLTLPSTVEKIASHAFNWCGLESLNIPANLKEIEEDAFLDARMLSDIQVSPENACFTLQDGILYDYAKTKIILATQSVSRELILPNSLQELKEDAFVENNLLVSVVIPEGITTIPECAFLYCQGLQRVSLPSTLTTIEWDAFYGCKSLRSIELPESITNLADDSFGYCEKLGTVINHSNLNLELGAETHGSVARYANILVDKNGNQIIRDGYEPLIVSTEGFAYRIENGEYIVHEYRGTENPVTLPTAIDGHPYRLDSVDGIVDVIIPEGVTEIDENAFANNRTLRSVTMADTVTSVGGRAFYRCYNLREVHFSNQLESIGSGAFDDCLSLTEIQFPETLRYIAEQAFSHCYNIESVILPDSVTEIGSRAFASISNLKEVRLPDNNQCQVRSSAFEYTGLKEVSIPKNIVLETGVFAETPYEKDQTHWVDGCLYAGDYLLSVAHNISWLDVSGKRVAPDAFKNAHSLKTLELDDKTSGELNENIETVILHGDLRKIHIPHTYSLKQIVIDTKQYLVSENGPITDATNISIYVRGYEKGDVLWDEDSPGWNNGNPVYYAGEWIQSDFYDTDGSVIDYVFNPVSAIIKQPATNPLVGEKETTRYVGWDLDGDGVVDVFPATSTVNMTAYAVKETENTRYRVTFLGKEGEVLSSAKMAYGEEIVPPAIPEIQGYTFVGWDGYRNKMTVSGPLMITSIWSHNGSGHEYRHTLVDATCEQEGCDLYTCSICGESYQENVIEPLGHSYGEWIITREPDCVEEGEQYRTCQICGQQEEAIIPENGHMFSSEVTVAPTCECEGTVVYTCSVCGIEIPEKISKIPHEYTTVEIPVETAKALRKEDSSASIVIRDDYASCSVCNNCKILESGRTYLGAAAQSTCKHPSTSRKCMTGTTCLTGGIEGIVCDSCGAVLHMYKIEAIGHDIRTDEAVAATCTETGLTEGSHCSRCGEVLVAQETVPAKGHSWNSSYTVDKQATCLEEGSKSIHCSRCDEKKDSTAIAAPGHQLITDEYLAPTCTDEGLTEGVHCKRCDYILTPQEVIPALGHTYEEWNDIIAPTCTESGTRQRICSVCGDVETDYPEPTGHSWSEDYTINIEPSCVKEGEKSLHCTVCDAIEDVIIVPSAGHQFGEWETIVSPDCVNSESQSRSCSVCGIREVNNLDPAGHEWEGEYTVDVEATCTTEGSMSIHCVNCDAVMESQIIEKTAHQLGEPQTIIPESCETSGTAKRVCVNCDYTETEVIEASGHDPVIDSKIEATCIRSGKTEGSHCSVCGKILIGQKEIPPLKSGISIKGISMSLFDNGMIGLNYYVRVTDQISQGNISGSLTVTGDDSIAFVLNEDNLVDFEEITEDGEAHGYRIYKVKMPLSAAQLSDAVEIVLNAEGEAVLTEEKSALDYAEYIFEHSDDYAKESELLKAVLNYGAESQQYFDHHTDNLANRILSERDREILVPSEVLSEYKADITGSLENVEYYGSSLVLTSDFRIRHYFFIGEDVDVNSLSFTFDGAAAEPVKKGNLCYVELSGIGVDMIDRSYPLVIKSGMENQTINYSVLSYIFEAGEQNKGDELIRLVHAIYSYGRAYQVYLS